MPQTDKLNTDRLREDVNAVSDDIIVLTRDAVQAMRQAADAIAAQATAKTGDAVTAAQNIAGEARVMTENGIDQLSKSVARNPITSLAIAAGAGLVVGWMTRSDARH